MKPRALAITIGVACAASVPLAQATNGYMSHSYSPHAKGMAGAGETALPQDSLSIVGNPAGLTRIGKRIDLGAAWFSPHREYDGAAAQNSEYPIGSTGLDGTVTSQHDNFFIPNFGMSYPLDGVSSVGVAVFGNGGMNTQYPSTSTWNGFGTYGANIPSAMGGGNPPALPFSAPGVTSLGSGNTGVNLEQLGIAFAYARDVTDNLSLGASFLVGYQKIQVKGLGGFQGFTQSFTESVFAGNAMSPDNLTNRGNDHSWGFGLQFGALWDINPQWSLGASYRTRMWMQDFSRYSDLFADNGSFDIPPVAAIGAAFKPTKQLTFALDLQWIGYGQVDAIANDNNLMTKCDAFNMFGNFAYFDSSYCLGGSNGAGFGWDNQTVVKFGAQYQLNDEWTVRAGYSHGTQVISDTQVAFNALAPAVVQNHFTVGASWKLRPNYELTFWGMYAPEETVSGQGAFTGYSSPAIKMYQYEVGVNFAWLLD